MTLTENIDRLMNEKGINKSTLSKESGIPYTTIDGIYKKGYENIKLSTIRKISDYFGITLDELIGEPTANKIEMCKSISKAFEEYPLTKLQVEMLDKYNELDAHGKKMVDFTLNEEYDRCTTVEEPQPIIQTTHFDFIECGGVSAGLGEMLNDDECIEQIEIEETPETYQADFAIQVNGDSMMPTYNDGDIVLVRKQPMVYEGEIGIFDVDGEGYIKELGNHELISHNRKYKPIKLTPYTDFRCFGKVVGVANVIN